VFLPMSRGEVLAARFPKPALPVPARACDPAREAGAEERAHPDRALVEGEARVEGRASAASEVSDLYRKHQRLVFHLGLRYGQGNVAWAEDVTQEVFLSLFKVIHTLRDTSDMEGWLYRATTNRCLNRLRRDRFLALAPVRWLLGEQQPPPSPPESLAIARDDLRRVLDAMNALDPKERVAFAMYYLDGKEQEEIGQVLGHTKGYVCKLIQRAVSRVRALGWEVDGG
jgi:RNA polymerase sigma-70 factor (ECF subfamily)